MQDTKISMHLKCPEQYPNLARLIIRFEKTLAISLTSSNSPIISQFLVARLAFQFVWLKFFMLLLRVLVFLVLVFALNSSAIFAIIGRWSVLLESSLETLVLLFRSELKYVWSRALSIVSLVNSDLGLSVKTIVPKGSKLTDKGNLNCGDERLFLGF